jgi:hypothetical protein
MAATLLDRIFKKRLYTAEDIDIIIAMILAGTYDKESVNSTIDEIDAFDAGAVDDSLRRHIYSALGKLVQKDKKMDRERRNKWRSVLEKGFRQ